VCLLHSHILAALEQRTFEASLKPLSSACQSFPFLNLDLSDLFFSLSLDPLWKQFCVFAHSAESMEIKHICSSSSVDLVGRTNKNISFPLKAVQNSFYALGIRSETRFSTEIKTKHIPTGLCVYHVL